MAIAAGALAVTAISGLVKGITGMVQKHRARKMLANQTYPTEGMPSETTENQSLARLRANAGLPSAQYNQAQQNIYRNQNAVLSANSDRRGGLMGIGGVQQKTNDALLGLDVANANARMNNERTLLDVNNQASATKRSLFNNNVRGKYLQDREYAMQLLGAGNQNFTSGLDTLGSSAGLLGYGGSNGMFSGGNGGGYQLGAEANGINATRSRYPSLNYVTQ